MKTRKVVIYKYQVTSFGIGFEGEPLRGCVTYLNFRDNGNTKFRNHEIFFYILWHNIFNVA